MAKRTAAQLKETRRQAAELRAAGVSYENIARQLGYRSVSSAFDAVQKGLEEAVREPTGSDVLQLELDRMDMLTSALWPKARRGDVTAVAAILKISETRAKLPAWYGLGQSTGGGEASPRDDIADRRAKRRAAAAGQLPS